MCDGCEWVEALEAGKHGVEELEFARASNQAVAKRAQDGRVEARVVEVEAESVLPVDVGVRGLDGLLVGRASGNLEHEDEVSNCLDRLAAGGEARDNVLSGGAGAKRITHGQIAVAPWGEGTGGSGSRFWCTPRG